MAAHVEDGGNDPKLSLEMGQGTTAAMGFLKLYSRRTNTLFTAKKTEHLSKS